MGLLYFVAHLLLLFDLQPDPLAKGRVDQAFYRPSVPEYNNDYVVLDKDYSVAKTLGTTGFSHSNETRAGMTMDGNGACSL